MPSPIARLTGLALACLASASGCHSSSAPACDLDDSTLVAAPLAIIAGQTANLTATFAKGTGQVAPGVGAVTSGTAVSVTPAATTDYTLTVTDSTCTVTRVATVTVSVVSVSISPQTPIVKTSKTVLFTATVTGSADTAVTWAVTGAGGGTIDSSGNYTAPAAPGTYHVVATSHADPSKSATATVTAATIVISVSPPSATMPVLTSQGFSAVVDGIADQAVDWSVQEGATGGALGADGTFTASIAGGTFHVVATSHSAPSASGSATVTLTGGLSAAAALANVVSSVHGDTARVAFDPFDGAKDYRIYVAPSLSDLANQADGGVTVRNGTYRCSGDREAPPVPTDGGTQVASGFVQTIVVHDVLGFPRTAAQAILGSVSPVPAPGFVPIYSMGDPASDADNQCYFQRWSESRVKKYVPASEHTTLLAAGWRDDGIAFYAPSGGSGISTVYTALSGTSRLYFGEAEKSARSGATAAFSVLAAAGPGTQPLYRVFYSNGCGKSHDELVVGKARFDRAVNQGLTAVPFVNWSGMTGPTTLVVEALDQGCPFQGHLSPQHFAGSSAHQEFFTLPQIRAADPLGEVFVNGQHAAQNRPRALGRALVQVTPAALEPMDFSDDFAPDGGTVLPLTPTAAPSSSCSIDTNLRFVSPAYDVTFYCLDQPYAAIAPMLGELWVTYADQASDTNGKFRLTVRQTATLSSTAFLHVMEEVDVATTNRRYPQILVSTGNAPVQNNLDTSSTLLVQTFGDWPPRVDIELCYHRTWDVNNQCPRFMVDKLSQDPFGNEPLPPHVEVGEVFGVDRRVRFDLYASTRRAYVLLDGQPWACANLPSTGGMPAGPVTVTFGDVLYHSGVDVPDPPYTFHQAHMRTETRRHLDALGFKSGVPAPAWDETRLPCTSTLN